MQYWLIKSEPSSYSWQQMQNDITTCWDGVRNYQARNYMKQMRLKDHAFFYHSGKDKEILGIVEVIKEYYPDHTDKTGQFGMVDVKYFQPLQNPITLKKIKSSKELSNILLIKQSRLSVMPITQSECDIIITLSKKYTKN